MAIGPSLLGPAWARNMGRLAWLWAVGFSPALLAQMPPEGYSEQAEADVVVIVDTSVSMKQPGMDPERASLLVTQLLADIVPGELAVVRLLDLVQDGRLLPSKPTGEKAPCGDDPGQMCDLVEPATDWGEKARKEKLGAQIRRQRADPQFKRQLESHLEQKSHNSPFDLAFHAAQGVFDEHPLRTEVRRTVVWLSDGRTDHELPLLSALGHLQDGGAGVEAIVFGKGDTRIAQQAGLSPVRASSPSEMMKAFAGAFRRMVRAPFEIDNLVSQDPTFQMKPYVDEAWVVIYGDESLQEVQLQGPDGRHPADYAQGRHPGAGAYRAAYFRKPPAGGWTVEVRGGGSGTAYAVVQRSALIPVLLDPPSAAAGVETALTAGIRAGTQGELMQDPRILDGMTVEAEHQGQTVLLQPAAAGRFQGVMRFSQVGTATVRLHAVNDLVDRFGEGTVQVSSSFTLRAGAKLEADLGRLGLSQESCRSFALPTEEHQGSVPIELELARSLPDDHQLEVRMPGGALRPGAQPVPLPPGEKIEVCLLTGPTAPFSVAGGELWLKIRPAGSRDARQQLPVHLRWDVQGLTFWQRWGWLILTLLGLLLLGFIVAGYIVPQRFRRGLALVFAPEREELDEQTPQPLAQWKGIGIGFYRDAQAFLHSNYRLSGNARGALAGLRAQRRGLLVFPGKGVQLHREDAQGGWEPVPDSGRKGRSGDIFRSGERGPFFRISFSRG